MVYGSPIRCPLLDSSDGELERPGSPQFGSSPPRSSSATSTAKSSTENLRNESMDTEDEDGKVKCVDVSNDSGVSFSIKTSPLRSRFRKLRTRMRLSYSNQDIPSATRSVSSGSSAVKSGSDGGNDGKKCSSPAVRSVQETDLIPSSGPTSGTCSIESSPPFRKLRRLGIESPTVERKSNRRSLAGRAANDQATAILQEPPHFRLSDSDMKDEEGSPFKIRGADLTPASSPSDKCTPCTPAVRLHFAAMATPSPSAASNYGAPATPSPSVCRRTFEVMTKETGECLSPVRKIAGGRQSMRPINGGRVRIMEPNKNPYTPDNNRSHELYLMRTRRPTSAKVTSLNLTVEQAAITGSRYKKSFQETLELGVGKFGRVALATNYYDGADYAIKRSHDRLITSQQNGNKSAHSEIFALSFLGHHRCIIRYYAAWEEDGYSFLQMEFCNGGSLDQCLEIHRQDGCALNESMVICLLKDVGQGLRYMHGKEVAHTDIKPGNILLCYEDGPQAQDSGKQDERKITFKIGDLGLSTTFNCEPVVEGDCRYLPAEALNRTSHLYNYLDRIDTFSLALTGYEAASLQTMPKNGDIWRKHREEGLPSLPEPYSPELSSLLQKMAVNIPQDRPTMEDILDDPLLCPFSDMSPEELRQELLAIRATVRAYKGNEKMQQ